MIIINVVLCILIWNCLFSKTGSLYCGLVGFSSKTAASLDKLRMLLLLNQERGKDSVGYYSTITASKEEPILNKYKGKPTEVLIDKDFVLPPCNLFIGHVRAATVGGVTVSNAHPFEHGNIVLAMNGTLDNHWAIARKYDVSTTKIHVDSEVLCAVLNKAQSKKPLTEILGPCAIIYTDKNTNKMYVYRNIDRPLYRGMINGSMYISSLEDSLKMIQCDNIKEFKENTLYEIFDGVIEKTYHVVRAKVEKSNDESLSKNSSNVVVNSDGDLIYKIDFVGVKESSLVGKFIKPRESYRNFSGHGEAAPSFNVNYYYEVQSYEDSKRAIIFLIDDNKKKVAISKFAFEPWFLLYSQGCFARLTDDISYNKTNKQVGWVGDLLKVNSIDIKNQTIFVENFRNRKTFTIPEELARPLGYLEANDIIWGEPSKKNIPQLPEASTTEEYPEHPFAGADAIPDKKNIIEAVPLSDNTLKVEDFGDIKQLADYTLENILNIVSDLEGWCYSIEAKTKCCEIVDFITIYTNTAEKIKELEHARK